MFYLVIAVLGFVAAGFACWPLLQPRVSKAAAEHDLAVKTLYRERLEELGRETEDPELRAEMETELGAVLLSETDGNPSRSDADPRAAGAAAGTSLLGWALALLVPLLGIAAYFTVAEPGLQQIRGAEEVLSLGMEDDVALQSWALKLEERVADAPGDGKSWYLLGHSYLKLRRFAEAAEAFATTNRLSPMDLGVQVYWLQARYLAAGGKLDTTSRNLAEGILAQQPEIPIVIEMLALDAFHRGDPAQAVSLLNKAMTGATDIRQQANFANAIAQVRASMPDTPPGVTVNVSANGDTPAHATVFVLARPVGGGMPYAVVRRPSFLLPFSVQLDDLVSMSPERKLSSAAEFEVVARLSLSGNAMPQADDWQWTSVPLQSPSSEGMALDALLTPP